MTHQRAAPNRRKVWCLLLRLARAANRIGHLVASFCRFFLGITVCRLWRLKLDNDFTQIYGHCRTSVGRHSLRVNCYQWCLTRQSFRTLWSRSRLDLSDWDWDQTVLPRDRLRPTFRSPDPCGDQNIGYTSIKARSWSYGSFLSQQLWPYLKTALHVS